MDATEAIAIAVVLLDYALTKGIKTMERSAWWWSACVLLDYALTKGIKTTLVIRFEQSSNVLLDYALTKGIKTQTHRVIDSNDLGPTGLRPD